MNYELITGLVAFAFASSATPGPNNLMLMASGTNFGFNRTLRHMFGVNLGFMFMVVLVGVGLIELFSAFPLTYLFLKIASIAYLLFLAWKTAIAAPFDDDPNQQATRKPFTFLQAALFQWVNPKAWAMSTTAITVYTPPSSPLDSVLLVAAAFGLTNLPCICAWVMLGTQLRRLLTDPVKLRTFNCVAALLLVASLYPILFG